MIHITQGPLTILARDSEIDSEVDARFALSLHVFVSRLFGWTLLEGAVKKKKGKKRRKKKERKKERNNEKKRKKEIQKRKKVKKKD